MALIPAGFRVSGVRCGLKNKRRDIGLIVADEPASVAGCFTQNLVRAACVDFSQARVQQGTAQALVVNSGNANCCTGEQGRRDNERMAELAARVLDVPVQSVLTASTGVIGTLLDMSKVESGIYDAVAKLEKNPQPFQEAILTTDLIEKSAGAQVQGTQWYIAGKGSGMIAPNMATMLAFILTDARVEPERLQASLSKVVAETFNCLLVDGDTSTNDMVLAMASGRSEQSLDDAALEGALRSLCIQMCKLIARDGEGATKLIEVTVRGSDDPERIARTIASSPLVKTAMFGGDPNWGRIMAAAGRSGVSFAVEDAKLYVRAGQEQHLLFEDGSPAPFDVRRASGVLSQDAVEIRLDLGPGKEATIYTCDLGYGYVRINAEYHT